MFSCFKCSIRSEKITISENPVSENPISENPITSNLITIIMAGGLGKRMNSPIPKVLHLVKDKPMIYYVIQKALEINSTHILIIVGKYKDLIQKEIESLFSATDYSRIVYIDQPEVLINEELKVQGTGDAIKCCIPFLVSNNINPESNVIILSGDVPLIEKDTIENLLLKQNTLLITSLEHPTGCGRIIFSEDRQHILKIVEEKDCTEEERNIKHVNCGIYNLTAKNIIEYIPLIKNENKNQEYYLTDIVELIANPKLNYYELPLEKQSQIININTKEELDNVNNKFI